MAGGNGDIYGGLNEADLLAWVEGEALPRDREAAVTRALAANPALARRLNSMRADRSLLAQLPDPAAPAGLVEAVESHLERRMLLGLQQGEPLSDSPPVSIVTPSRRSAGVVGRVFDHAIGRKLALAAGLMLLVGGAVYLASITFSGAKLWRPPRGTIAQAPVPATGGSSAEIAAAPAAAGPNPVEPPSTAIAAKTEESSAAATESPTMTAARAADLARQRRLVIRVQTLDPDTAAARIGRDADRVARSSAPWRISRGAPPEVVAAVTPRDTGGQARPPAAPALPVLADEGARAPHETIDLPQIPMPVFHVPDRPVFMYMLATPADAAMLEQALRVLNSTSAQTATFEEAPAALPATPPILTTSAILWWTQPPSAWNEWVAVPVVVGK